MLHRCQGCSPFQGWALPLLRFKVQPRVLWLAASSMHSSHPRTAMEKIAEVVDLGELFADRARVGDDPGKRARSRRTILKSSSILDVDTRGPLGQKKFPECQSPETGLEHVCQSARRDCRVSTNPGARIGAEGRVRQLSLHYHPQEVWSRCSSGHTSVICVCRLDVATWQPIVVNLATKRTSTRCVCRLNAA